jgi:hypothetical protein
MLDYLITFILGNRAELRPILTWASGLVTPILGVPRSSEIFLRRLMGLEGAWCYMGAILKGLVCLLMSSFFLRILGRTKVVMGGSDAGS